MDESLVHYHNFWLWNPRVVLPASYLKYFNQKKSYLKYMWIWWKYLYLPGEATKDEIIVFKKYRLLKSGGLSTNVKGVL